MTMPRPGPHVIREGSGTRRLRNAKAQERKDLGTQRRCRDLYGQTIPSIQLDAVGWSPTCQTFAQTCCQDLPGRESQEEPAMFDLNRLLNVLSPRAEAAADFRRMLEWKLLRGSHEFPGPDGGTCINEAAIVAAGYPYRAVYCVKDLPASFSRPIAMLALCLNDTLDDELRQELLVPFVTRLAGSADIPKTEMMRAQLIHERVVSGILLPAVLRHGNAELARRCRSLGTPAELAEVTRCLRFGGHHPPLHRSLIAAFAHAADVVAQGRSGQP